MTTLILFNSERSRKPDEVVQASPDWGTGQRRKRSNSDPNGDHPSGTFLHRGETITQNYRNTDITLSNVRSNDELIPAPFHTINLTPHQIPLKFPSNHPYSSHISEKAVFPNASVNLTDRPSTDIDPYIVTHKIRGNPYRREVHYHGLPRQQSLQWPDKYYMHLPRSLSDADLSSIYPWPRKLFAPNDSNSIPTSGSNIVKNKEKVLFETTYQGDYSNGDGLGSHVTYDTSPRLSPNEQLKPYFKKTLDPVRPMEGMQVMHIQGNHRQPSALEKHRTLTSEPIKLMSEDEHLDDQLQNGTDYVNLPAHMFQTERAATWIPRSEPAQTDSPRPELRFLHYLDPPTTVPQLVHDHQFSHQQIEAENRLKQLEAIRPKDSINLLNLKFRSLQHSHHGRPTLPQYHDAYVNTFYDQVGTYIHERAGLYHTENYDPNALTQSMPDLNEAGNKPEENDNSLNDESNLAELLANGEQAQSKSKSKLFQYKTFGDHQAMRNRLVNKFRVPQEANAVDPRVQEGPNPFIQRESVYGQSFNTRKFLQENTLSPQARADPTRLISTRYNSNIERVRNVNSCPIKPSTNQWIDAPEEKPSDDIVLGPFLPPSPYNELFSSKYITEQTNGYSRRSTNRVYESPFKTQQDMLAYKFHKKPATPPVIVHPQATSQLPTAAKMNLALPGPEMVSRSVDSKTALHSIYQRSYKDIAYHEIIPPIYDSKVPSLSMRDNEQSFGRGKQWKLIDLQDHWTKTKAQREYHTDHPESIPYVGDATLRAKKEILIADRLERQRMMTVR